MPVGPPRRRPPSRPAPARRICGSCTRPATTGTIRTARASSGPSPRARATIRGAQAYWSLLGLTSPRGPSDGNDLGIGLQNDGLGLLTLQAGYEQPLGGRWTALLAAGWLRADEPHPLSGSPDIGTELLAETRWQMASLLALEVGGSVLLTGDFFRAAPAAPAPAALYELYSRWQLEFLQAAGRPAPTACKMFCPACAGDDPPCAAEPDCD